MLTTNVNYGDVDATFNSGANPDSSMLLGLDGFLYGTAKNEGAGDGNLYKFIINSENNFDFINLIEF